MKLEFDVKVTEKDLYSFNIEQAYKGSQGVISLLFAVLLAAAAVLSAQKGNTEYVVLYIIVGILVLLYVPFSLKGRVKMIMKTNEVFSKPLHFEIDEKNIKVSQGDEMAQQAVLLDVKARENPARTGEEVLGPLEDHAQPLESLEGEGPHPPGGEDAPG